MDAHVFPVRDQFRRNARFNHVDNALDPEVIGEKRLSSRGDDAVVVRPCEDQVDGVTVDVCRFTDVLDNVNGVD